MKKKAAAVTAAAVVFALVFAAAAFTFGTEINITVKNRVTIYINGEKINPADVNGNAVSAFVYDVFSCNGNLRSAGKEC